MAKERKTDLVEAVKGKGKTLEAEMSFFDHLSELRIHLIRASIAVIFFTIICFFFYDFIFDTVIMGPRKSTFWTYRIMCQIGEYFNKSGFCIENIPGKIINTEMAGQFTLQINSALMTGVILGFPYLLWEIWRFVKPALKDSERKSASGFVLYASLLFIVGLLFGYFLILLWSVRFIVEFVKESQGGIESLFGVLSTGQWLSIPFILAGLFYLFLAEKPFDEYFKDEE